ncbi:MAG: hypothetical protein AAGA48_36200 [Myxococcota bacterium]
MSAPTTTAWNRLESATVANDLEEGLEARIADPMWLLARQWQTGEFHGEDATTPLLVSASVGWSAVDHFRTKGAPWLPRTDLTQPLEVLVEREALRNGPAHTRHAADAGLMFLRALDLEGQGSHKAAFRNQFPLTIPAPDGRSVEGELVLGLLQRRSLDGFALYDAVENGIVWGTLPQSVAAGDRPDVEQALLAFRGWFQDFVRVPGSQETAAWNSRRMEYDHFALSGPVEGGAAGLEAREYPGGHLDWYAFDHLPGTEALPSPSGFQHSKTHVTLPTPLRFPGMPAGRWWEIEDRSVWWGDVEGGPDDLARYLVASFAAVYGDDWSVVPFSIPRGTLSGVLYVSVLDSYGTVHNLDPLAKTDGSDRVWKFFELTNDPRPDQDDSPLMFLAPAIVDREESDDVELVDFMRDEGANMAWAIERLVEHPSGLSIDRRELWESQALSSTSPVDDTWKYRLMTLVPDYWVPLVPVRLDDTGQIGLLRGRMPRIVNRDGVAASTSAQGHILEPQNMLLVEEDEVPRGGATVNRRYQYARGVDGKVHLWMGRHKRAGAGSQESGLRFDSIERPKT